MLDKIAVLLEEIRNGVDNKSLPVEELILKLAELGEEIYRRQAEEIAGLLTEVQATSLNFPDVRYGRKK